MHTLFERPDKLLKNWSKKFERLYQNNKDFYLLSLVLLSVHLLVEGSASAEAAALVRDGQGFSLSSRPGQTVLPAAEANAAAFGTSRWR